MKIYLHTSPGKNNETAVNIGLFSFCESLYENSYHSIFSLVLIGTYIYKILTKQSSQFKPFLSFHILMHISIISLFILILNAKYQLGKYFNLFTAVIFFQSFIIHAFNCLNLSITIFDFGPTVNTKKLRLVLMIIGFILKIALGPVKLVVELSEQKILTLFIENVLCILNLVLVGVLVMSKKISKKNKFGIIIHSSLSSASFLLFQLIDGMILLHMGRPEKLHNHDIFIFSAYYFVFFWIISMYITNFKAMKKYNGSDTIENPYIEKMTELGDSSQPKI